MANILGLFGANKSDGSTSALIAAYLNDLFILSGANWLGQGIPLKSDNKWEFAQILDIVLGVNFNDDTKRYNYTAWSNETAKKAAPISKFIHTNNAHERVYFGNIKFSSFTFNTKVWYSDIPRNNDLTYGLTYGTDLSQNKSSPVISSAQAYWKLRNLKVGDPIFITTGDNAGQYFIASIDNEKFVTLTEALPSEAAVTGSTFWAGGNWVDIQTEVTGLGENADRELLFGRNKVFSYDRVKPRQIKGVPGTTSHRSIINRDQFTFWFHPTGIYRLAGTEATLISRPIQKYINGISAANYDEVVAEAVGNERKRIRFHVGNISNSDENITITNAFLEYDMATGTWTPGRTKDRIVVASTFVESGAENIYFGNDQGQVFQDDTGNADDNDPIEFFIDTGFHFPRIDLPKLMLEFTRIEAHCKNGRGMPVKYKLYGTPFSVDKEWRPLNDITNDVTEMKFNAKNPDETLARGIAFHIDEISENKPPLVERIDVYYKERYDRSL